jgi:glycosyltransferase involved in cell wall biosynthesis
MQDWLRDHGVRTPTSVVPPAVESKAPGPGSREQIRARFGIPPDAPVLLFVGRIGPEKNLDFLLRAVALLPRGRDCCLMLVGSGVDEARLARLAADLGLADRTILTGEVPHDSTPDYYAAGDIFVFPSPSDTFGLVLLEAMNAGLPCVAVGVNGPRAVLEDEVTGLLTPVEEPAFATAIERLLANSDLRQRMGHAAAEHSRSCSADEAGRRLIDAYSLALGRELTGLRPGPSPSVVQTPKHRPLHPTAAAPAHRRPT